MNTLNQTGSEAENERDALVSTAIHGVMGLALFLSVVFWVPTLSEIFSGRGARLPTPTEHLLAWSEHCRKYFFLYLPFIAFLLWFDSRIFQCIYRRYGKSVARWFSRAVTFGLISVIAYCSYGAVIPFIKLAEVTAAPR